VIDPAVEGRLKAYGLEPQVEKASWVPFGPKARLTPGLVERGSVELQVEAQVIGDGQGER
jgi:hypothetical protein